MQIHDAPPDKRELVVFIVSTRQAHRQHSGGFRFEREIGQHIGHQDLIDELLLEGDPMRGMVDRLRHGLPH